MRTCRHFRFQLPREVSDELRDADPSCCDVCDALPHRRRLTGFLTSTNSTFSDFENRDVFGALTISLACCDDVPVAPATETATQESSSPLERMK